MITVRLGFSLVKIATKQQIYVPDLEWPLNIEANYTDEALLTDCNHSYKREIRLVMENHVQEGAVHT